MRSITVWSIGTAVGFAALGVGFLIWWYGITEYRPVYKPNPARLAEFVQSTSDIEHLRKFSQLQLRQHDAMVRGANEIIEQAINVIIFLALACAVSSLLGWLSALKAHRLGQGRPIPGWLRWL
jgi:hypothetical protein